MIEDPRYDDNYLSSFELSEKECEKQDYYADISYEEKLVERMERGKMERKIIDLTTTNMTFEESTQLKNYVWEGNCLIPSEMIEGE